MSEKINAPFVVFNLSTCRRSAIDVVLHWDEKHRRQNGNHIALGLVRRKPNDLLSFFNESSLLS